MAASSVKEATVQCSPCKRNKEETNAVFWCNNCNEGLCQECSYHHTRNKLCVNHKVLPLSDIYHELLLLDNLDIITQCESHPDHQKTVFCEDDDVFCCTICSSTDHRRCYNVQSIDTAVKSYTSSIRETDIQDINTLVVLVDMEIEQRKSAIKEAKVNSTEFLRNVQARFDMTTKELQKKRTSIEGEIKEAEQKVTQFHNTCIDAHENLKKELNKNLNVLHADQKLSAVQNIIARYKAIHAFKTQTEETIKTVSSDIPEIKISFNKTLTMNDHNLGTVAIEQRESEKSVFLTECEMMIDKLCRHLFNKGTAQIAREPVPLISCDTSFVASAERSNIQAGGRTPDGTYLPDNTILICDYCNKQLIKLDEYLGFLEKLPVAGWPYGVCVGSDSNCVHVVCDYNKVVSYALQGPWREVHRFGTEDNACGIACYGDRIVTGHVGGDFFIYDSTGTKVSSIKTLGWSLYPALSNNGRMLYHGDSDHDVVCRSMEDVTQEVWRYSSQKLQGPYGIDTDRDGNILLAGYGSVNIYQVSEDRKQNRILVNKMKYMWKPIGLFTNKKSNTFCVTSEDYTDKVCVEMYRFEDSFKAKSPPNTPKQNETFKDFVFVEKF